MRFAFGSNARIDAVALRAAITRREYVAPAGRCSACANAPAVLKRSAGILASAWSTVSSSSSGTFSRTIASDGTRSIVWRAMIDAAVGPTKGGVPAIIS